MTTDRKERQLNQRVNQAASALRKALREHKSIEVITPLGDALAKAQNELVAYKRNRPLK